ncbi:hypothetical protein R1flu_014603 [Riccia fluitans]|uniref:Uncharacterized protein n=1 Tax=Riccia fluitans TaxID=41844 RepID=A0ABD1YKC8_9MARC
MGSDKFTSLSFSSGSSCSKEEIKNDLDQRADDEEKGGGEGRRRSSERKKVEFVYVVGHGLEGEKPGEESGAIEGRLGEAEEEKITRSEILESKCSLHCPLGVERYEERILGHLGVGSITLIAAFA